MALYDREWATFRRLRWVGIAFLAALILLTITSVAPMPRSRIASNLWLADDLFFGLGLGWLYCVVRLELFRCPRCGERYFYRTTLMDRSPFRRRCGHCQPKLFGHP